MKDKEQWQLTKVQPCLRLRGEGAVSPLFVQEGVIYAEGGEVIAEPPDWFWEEARKCTPQARAEVGLVLPEERPPAAGSEQFHKPVEEEEEPILLDRRRGKAWTCPDCGEEMKTRQKGAHVMRHRRAAKKGA